MVGDGLGAEYFSKTYGEARRRFLDAAESVDAQIQSHPLTIESSVDLAIDIATIGDDHLPTVLISSGVHGVEGFFASAIQLAFLNALGTTSDAPSVRYVLIHGVNPFGFARLRRFNEDNVDLNRNFLANDERYAGAPGGYAGLNSFLNPPSPPSRIEPTLIKALWAIARMGLQPMKEAVAGGQYDFPLGLFYGGSGPCESTRIIQRNCDSWIAASPSVVHIDFHSGLGRSGEYKLLLSTESAPQELAWYGDAFGAEFVEPATSQGAREKATAYTVTGMLGQWMQEHFRDRPYRFVAAEFGTYNVIRVVTAIRAENRMHHHGAIDDPRVEGVKRELLECFCPASTVWRSKVLRGGLAIIQQGARSIARADR